MPPMRRRQQQVLDLLEQGYSIPAIASRLNISEIAVRDASRAARVVLSNVPAGHITLREAARRMKLPRSKLRKAAGVGTLRCILHGSTYYTTMEWAHIWVANQPYRTAAREMALKLFQARPRLEKQ